MRRPLDILGGALGLLVGWGVLGSPAGALIAQLASRVADALAGFGGRLPPIGLAFSLVLGFLVWSVVWIAAGVFCARAYTAFRLRRPGRVRRAA